MDQQSLVKTLISQHRILQADLGKISDMLDEIDEQAGEIVSTLEKFKLDLSTHLKLENGTFYPSLLDHMKAKNMATEDTEKFISEMKDIEKIVLDFLKKYDASQKIKESPKNFKNDFPPIVTTLNLRIESEEEGVYETFLYL